jgi:hypothetical protein
MGWAWDGHGLVIDGSGVYYHGIEKSFHGWYCGSYRRDGGSREATVIVIAVRRSLDAVDTNTSKLRPIASSPLSCRHIRYKQVRPARETSAATTQHNNRSALVPC